MHRGTVTLREARERPQQRTREDQVMLPQPLAAATVVHRRDLPVVNLWSTGWELNP